ncbi:hypothetical protein VSU19_22935 [Verrucomicrobiales bacterium BCK34]|nr:hypothetical protein [Verrucomicrobiales bacterium BCK34]
MERAVASEFLDGASHGLGGEVVIQRLRRGPEAIHEAHIPLGFGAQRNFASGPLVVAVGGAPSKIVAEQLGGGLLAEVIFCVYFLNHWIM